RAGAGRDRPGPVRLRRRGRRDAPDVRAPRRHAGPGPRRGRLGPARGLAGERDAGPDGDGAAPAPRGAGPGRSLPGLNASPRGPALRAAAVYPTVQVTGWETRQSPVSLDQLPWTAKVPVLSLMFCTRPGPLLWQGQRSPF